MFLRNVNRTVAVRSSCVSQPQTPQMQLPLTSNCGKLCKISYSIYVCSYVYLLQVYKSVIHAHAIFVVTLHGLN